MSGELTLRGVVLPVGGVKEKVLAAYRDGLTNIILPEQNRKDLKDIQAGIKVSCRTRPEKGSIDLSGFFPQQDEIRFHFVRSAEQVLERALGLKMDDVEAKIEKGRIRHDSKL